MNECLVVDAAQPPPRPSWYPVSTFDADVFEGICVLIEEGNSIRSACQMMGLAFSTLYDWAEASTEASERFARARYRLGWHYWGKQAQHLAELENIDKWKTDMKGWTAKVAALKEAANIARDLSKRLVPELGDKSEVTTKSTTITYVVSFTPQNRADKAQVIDVQPVKLPAPIKEVKEVSQDSPVKRKPGRPRKEVKAKSVESQGKGRKAKVNK